MFYSNFEKGVFNEEDSFDVDCFNLFGFLFNVFGPSGERPWCYG